MSGRRIKINPTYLKRLIRKHFDVVDSRSSPEELVIICPEPGCPDSTGNRSINLTTGYVNCWRCTSNVGHVSKFLRAHQIEFDGESIEDIISSENIDALNATAQSSGPSATYSIVLPEGFTPIRDDPESGYSKAIAAMARRKNLYFDDFADAGVGYTKVGAWSPFAIFPVYEQGRTVYFQGRSFPLHMEGGVTKKFPSKKEYPFGSRYWIYGFDNILKPGLKTLIVVESILNVLSLRWELANQGIEHVEPVAVFKHKISKEQLTKILATTAPEICMMYDSDATDSSWKEAKLLSSYRTVSIAEMPDGVDANDDAKIAVDRFNNRQMFTSASELSYVANSI